MGPGPGTAAMAPNRVAGGSLAPEPHRPAGPAGPPRLARLLRRTAAGLLLAAGLVCAAAPAAAQQTAEVPQNWSLNPSGLGVGDKFRLIFLTSGSESGRRNAKSTDIADYNAFVQGRAESGHRAIREFASKFRVVGSTETVAARDNTGTTGTGVEIHWLDGGKVADNYGDFYDGSWDDEGNPRGKDGNRVDLGVRGPCTVAIVGYPFVWTGSNRDGTSHSSRFLGGGTTDASPVEAGRLSSDSATPLSGSNHKQIILRVLLRPLPGLHDRPRRRGLRRLDPVHAGERRQLRGGRDGAGAAHLHRGGRRHCHRHRQAPCLAERRRRGAARGPCLGLRHERPRVRLHGAGRGLRCRRRAAVLEHDAQCGLRTGFAERRDRRGVLRRLRARPRPSGAGRPVGRQGRRRLGGAGERRADDYRGGAGRADAERRDGAHPRPRRARFRDLRIPVDPGRPGARDRDRRGDGKHLHPGRGRCGQADPGPGRVRGR